jgi:uncharacterized membrane protein
MITVLILDFYSLTIATSHGQFARLLGGAFGVNLAAVIFKFYSNSSLKDLAQEVHMEVSIKNIELLKLMPDSMRRKVQMLCLDALNKIYLMGMYNVFIVYLNAYNIYICIVAIAAGITFLATLFIKKYNVSNKLNDVVSLKNASI